MQGHACRTELVNGDVLLSACHTWFWLATTGRHAQSFALFYLVIATPHDEENWNSNLKAVVFELKQTFRDDTFSTGKQEVGGLGRCGGKGEEGSYVAAAVAKRAAGKHFHRHLIRIRSLSHVLALSSCVRSMDPLTPNPTRGGEHVRRCTCIFTPSIFEHRALFS